MKNKRSLLARTHAAIAASIFSFVWASVSAAALAPNSTAEFQAIAESNLLVLGPVDAVEPSKAQVRVLGQWIPVSENQVSQNLDGLVGHLLAVYGSIAPDGTFEVATVSEQNSIEYVPGATHLYLKGSISAVDLLHGTARIGSLAVSYSGALHTLIAEDLSVGAVVSFSGLQFAGSSKLFADNGLVHQINLGPTGSGTSALGQTGSGGVHTLGQTGSGTSALGQTGSGTSALGQTGSGGVHTLGQTGSGTSALGQTGSGGVHTLGQTGSGTSALGQTGSGGVHTLGQTGSGTSALGQTGSGTSALGQTGSGGVHTLGQTGSGTSALGQTGSGGVHTLGQTGSGTSALGQTGSGGVHTLGQTGSGTSALGQTGSGGVHTARSGLAAACVGAMGQNWQRHIRAGSNRKWRRSHVRPDRQRYLGAWSDGQRHIRAGSNRKWRRSHVGPDGERYHGAWSDRQRHIRAGSNRKWRRSHVRSDRQRYVSAGSNW